MAHYAFLDENNIVVNVITGVDENTLIENLDPEIWYGNLHKLTCKRTSYNTRGNEHLEGGIPFRGNYAGIGYLYDPIEDVFIAPKPYESWILNSTTYSWEAPIPYPNDGKPYSWNENNIEWVELPFEE